MDEILRRDCISLFEACLAQIESGKPGPSMLTSRDFAGALSNLLERLRKEPAEEDATEGEGRFVLELIVKANLNSAKDGLSHLKNWLRGSEEIVVCDPYLMHFSATDLYPDVTSYAQVLLSLFPASAKRIDLYSNGYMSQVKPAIMRPLKDGRQARHFSSHGLHDRFVIKNRTEGKFIGTSFGGFGRKFFAISDLPRQDVSALLSELHALCPKPIKHGRR
ncbi:hypothetical protein FHX10_006732 [Rhizobium sp. BK591]|uniref:hypothetical protein n=1 Tax=Rhizobium sp. BK591 TaxID=2586985 RepID=UPI0013AEA0BC|nr:hypothetical protein [Rhizobium sp. BK591]MBB3747176.1 hypothetical protein [Rhizobium sp. BK591]